MLAGALIGAAVGAGIATAAIAVSDYQSGNVRSLGDAAFGIAGGALFGGVAGAAIAAAPFAAEFYTPLINAQLAVWGMTGASVGTGLVTAGFVGITGVNAAFTANNIVAMNSGYDFLGSTIFRNHPDIYMGVQIVTAFASMNILGTGLAMSTSQNQNHRETPIHNDVIDSPRTGSALKVDEVKPLYALDPSTGEYRMVQEFPTGTRAHGFTDIVDNYAGLATKTPIPNGTLYQLEGSLNGVSGRFEWIIQDGQVTHRMFVQNGTMNGVPIKP